MRSFAYKKQNWKLRQELKSATIIKREDPNIWKENKHRWYVWGRNQCMLLKLKDPIFNLLEIIIGVSNLQGYTQASKDSLLQAYNRKHPNHTISRRTLFNYLASLESSHLIQRFEQLEYNMPSAIRVLVPYPKLVDRSVQVLHTDNLSQINYRDRPLSALGSADAGFASDEEKDQKIINDLKAWEGNRTSQEILNELMAKS